MKNKLLLTFFINFILLHLYAQELILPVVLISGKVLNERSMQPVAAKIIYEILPEGKEAGIARSNPATGEYKIVLPFGKKYGYFALAQGYYSVTQNLDVSNLSEYTEIEEINLFLAPVKLEQVVRLNNIFFQTAKSTLKPESFPELSRFVEFLKVNKKIEIEIAGHTDNVDSEQSNLILSKNRAQAVADYLITHGIKAKRLTVKGFGGTKPIAFNTTDEGRQQNRRIEFKVISLTKVKNDINSKRN